MSTPQAHVHVSPSHGGHGGHAPRPVFVPVKGSPKPPRSGFARALLLLPLTIYVTACSDSNPADESRAGNELRDEALPIGQVHALDILVVVDNSGSMAEEQANLAAHFDGLLSSLEAKYGALDLRIGVTTTDVGNVLCSGTSPEAGALRLSSCRNRAQDFSNLQGTVSEFDIGCAAACPVGVNFIEPDFDEPWIEVSPEGSNLPDGLDLATTLACALPQGIKGCGFESTLESMSKAIQRAMTEGEVQHGFLRDDASLLVVILTDEEDCSMNWEWDEEVAPVQIPVDRRLFWSDPQANPTSAICWNAGVRCEAVPDGQLCFASDRGVGDPQQLPLGNNPLSSEDDVPSPGPWPTTIIEDPADPEQNAVMFPLSKYETLLDEVRATKQAVRWDATVSLAVFAGVPIGYHADPSIDIAYRTPDDPEVALNFGIDFGCESATGVAVPPVRLRELAEGYPMGEGRNLYSICEPSYESAFQDMATQLVAPPVAACLGRCAADADPTTTRLDVQCELVAERSDGSRRPLPACEGESVPAGATTCVQIHAGESLGDGCRADGKNVGFTFHHAAGAGFAPDEQVIASCLTTDDAAGRSCL